MAYKPPGCTGVSPWLQMNTIIKSKSNYRTLTTSTHTIRIRNTMSENDTEQLLQAQVRDKGENLSHGLVRRLAFGLRNQASSSSAKPVPVQGVRHNSQFQASTQQRPMIETASKVVKKRKASDSDMVCSY